MTANKYEDAVCAALPVIRNALGGDLDHEKALEWVQHILCQPLTTDTLTRDEAVAAVREALDTSVTPEEAQRRVLNIIERVDEVDPAIAGDDEVFHDFARLIVRIRERFQ